MVVDEPYLDRLINNQRFAAKRHVIFGVGILVAGLFMFALSLVWRQHPEGFKSILTAGSGFVSAMSLFPLNHFLTRKNNASSLEGLRPWLKRLKDKKINPKERARIEDQCLSIIEKIGFG